MNKDIEQRAEVASKILAKESTAPDKETPDWMLNDIRRGYIAGATEERERGKRFAEWINLAVYFPEDKKWYYDPLSSEMHTTEEMFAQFIAEDSKLNK